MKIAKYSHLSAKIRAMKGKMLSDDDYLQMMVKDSVADVAIYLKNNTYYNDALESIDTNDVHRGHLEVYLYSAEIIDALKIARYLKGNERKIYRFVYRRQEIENVKMMLRMLQLGGSLENIDKKRLFISHFNVIDFEKSLAATNIRELVETLKHTNFYALLNPLVIDDNKIDLYQAEMSLDMYYYSKLKTQIKSLVSGEDRVIIDDYFGSEADLKNVLWIYRGKKYYSMDKEMLYRYLIPMHHKLSKEDIVKMIDAKSADQVVELARASFYNEEFSGKIVHWESEFMRRMLKTQLNYMRLYPFSIAPIVGYIFAKEVEIHDIITIVEGVRYQLEPDNIKKQLIMSLA
jgi:V/A-type H+-transporting ATPase subunit C